MASKKRQREDEERKEKERKRMRVEYKLPAEKVEKEMKSQAIDGRGPGGKKSKDETANKKMEAERGFDNSRKFSETQPSTSGISISNAGRESIVHEEFHEASSNIIKQSKNCLAFAVSCQNRAEPATFFPPESFCCISEVLLPRNHQLNNSRMR